MQPDSTAFMQFGDQAARLSSDEEFDRVYPVSVRQASTHHWTSVAACRQAARWLVAGPHTRVLDIGCGPGKFCAIGALSTPGHFTGVEQRKHLCRTAQIMIERYRIERVDILHANVTELAFDSFDAFYLFNPFEENLRPEYRIDDAVRVDADLYGQYVGHVRSELARARPGARVVTYWGDCEEVPDCYDCVQTAFDRELRLWVKRGEESTSSDPVALPLAVKRQSQPPEDGLPARLGQRASCLPGWLSWVPNPGWKLGLRNSQEGCSPVFS